MKQRYIIKRSVILPNNEIKEESFLYNFCYVGEARKRLQSIKNVCRYPIIESDKNTFICCKGYSNMKFEVLKQN